MEDDDKARTPLMKLQENVKILLARLQITERLNEEYEKLCNSLTDSVTTLQEELQQKEAELTNFRQRAQQDRLAVSVLLMKNQENTQQLKELEQKLKQEEEYRRQQNENFKKVIERQESLEKNRVELNHELRQQMLQADKQFGMSINYNSAALVISFFACLASFVAFKSKKSD